MWGDRGEMGRGDRSTLSTKHGLKSGGHRFTSTRRMDRTLAYQMDLSVLTMIKSCPTINEATFTSKSHKNDKIYSSSMLFLGLGLQFVACLRFHVFVVDQKNQRYLSFDSLLKSHSWRVSDI